MKFLFLFYNYWQRNFDFTHKNTCPTYTSNEEYQINKEIKIFQRNANNGKTYCNSKAT